MCPHPQCSELSSSQVYLYICSTAQAPAYMKCLSLLSPPNLFLVLAFFPFIYLLPLSQRFSLSTDFWLCLLIMFIICFLILQYFTETFLLIWGRFSPK